TLPNLVTIANSLPQILHQAAQRSTGIFLVGEQEHPDFLAYSDLLQAAEKILHSLRQRGLQPQDRVIIQLLDPQYFLVCLWGCFLGGYVPIPLGMDLNLDRPKLRQAVELFTPSMIVTEGNIAGLATVEVEDLFKGDRDSQWYEGNLDDLALLLMTSGSTGKPKGVMLSARNLIASVYGMARVNQLSSQDITLNWMPLEHVASLVMFHLTEVYLGCQQIQVNSELILPDPLQWLNLIDRHRVTASWSPNFAYNLVNEKLSQPDTQVNGDLSCLRWMGNGAEAVVGETAGRFIELLAPYGLSTQVVSPGYGMSEPTSGIAHAQDFYLHLDREYVSVGAPIPGVSLRIVDEKNQPVFEGTVGLLQVQGATVTMGYYQQPELNREI
ncbi:MAG: AMP-binding protein, partial [Cyanobacteria bacterium J06635_13]